MPNNSTIDLVSPEGELQTLPSENQASALEQGFTTPTPEQLKDFSEKQVYSQYPGLAASVGAVKGALPFGIGAAALKRLGVSPEIQEGLAKNNPLSSTGGEIGGMFAPETGLAGIAGKVGHAAAGLVKLVGLGEDAGVAAKIASTAVRGAAEGATFGASNVANDAVLGDPNVVAGHALDQIGTSALWGAGIAGGLGATAAIVPKSLAGAKSALGSVSDSLGISSAMDSVKNAAQEGFASLSSPVSKIPKDQIMEAFARVGKEEAPIKAVEFSKSLQELHSATEDALKDAINGFDSLTPDTQEAIGDYLKSVDSIKNTGDFAKQFMYKSKGELKIDPGKVETFLKNTNSAKGVKAADAFSNYIDSSGNLIDHLNHEYVLGASESSPDLDSIKGLVDKNRGVLEQQQDAARAQKLSQSAQGSGGYGEAAGIGAAGSLLGIPHPLIAAGIAGFEALRNPLETISKLAKLQDTVSNSANRIARLADNLASPTSKVGELARGYAAGKIASDDKAKYDKITKQIESLNSDINGTTDKIHANTQVLEPHAPAIAASMQQTAGRAITFLASKIQPMTAPGPLARKPEPSAAQIASFNRYYQAVEKPTSVLREAAKGTLTHEAIEALATVHPALYDQIKQSLMVSLSDNKKVKELPYQRKLMLSLLLGQNLDGSMAPMAIQANQQQLAISNAQAQAKQQAFIGTPKPTSKGMREISISERALTAQQASSQRTGA